MVAHVQKTASERLYKARLAAAFNLLWAGEDKPDSLFALLMYLSGADQY